MNIFVLDKDIGQCAAYMADKHVVKMLTETAQMLSSAYYFTGQQDMAPYRFVARESSVLCVGQKVGRQLAVASCVRACAL